MDVATAMWVTGLMLVGAALGVAAAGVLGALIAVGVVLFVVGAVADWRGLLE